MFPHFLLRGLPRQHLLPRVRLFACKPNWFQEQSWNNRSIPCTYKTSCFPFVHLAVNDILQGLLRHSSKWETEPSVYFKDFLAKCIK
jgi:hypothetical protein